MGTLDVGPTAGQRGNFVQAHCVGLGRTVTKAVGVRSVCLCMALVFVVAVAAAAARTSGFEMCWTLSKKCSAKHLKLSKQTNRHTKLGK